MTGEGPVAFAADVAADAGVDFHVLLQRRLGLETLPTEQAEDGHVRAGVDLPVSLQGFLRLKLGATLVTHYGLLTS